MVADDVSLGSPKVLSFVWTKRQRDHNRIMEKEKKSPIKWSSDVMLPVNKFDMMA